MKNYAYKIVTSSLRSFLTVKLSDSYTKSFAIQYIENEWIDGQGIFVFETESDARNWLCDYRGMTYLYKCEVKKIRPVKTIVRWNYIEELKAFVQLRKQKKRCDYLASAPAPKGSMHCSSIKLVERIPW